jgi:hypothetical protein
MDDDIFAWPNLLPDKEHATEDDLYWASWAYRSYSTLGDVYDMMSKPMPDDPRQLDELVTQQIDGWLPRVASLAVKAEFFLNAAKAAKWPAQFDSEGNKLTVTDREVQYDTALAPYRFVRDELDSLTKRMVDRVRWAQSVRKVQGDAQGGY